MRVTILDRQHGCEGGIAMPSTPCGSRNSSIVVISPPGGSHSPGNVSKEGDIARPAGGSSVATDLGRNTLRWYCICTHPQREHEVNGRLTEQGFTAFLPLYLDRTKEHDRILPMFRGYMFAKFDVVSDPWRKICSTRGVWHIISSSPERPLPLPDGIVDDLIHRSSPRGVVDDPGSERECGEPNVSLGANARVLEGPLAGWQGICTMSSHKRVRLLMRLFSGTREVEFKASVVNEV